MPATYEGFETFLGGLGATDTGYDPNLAYDDTSAYDNAIDSSGSYETTDFTTPETSGYVDEALGIAPLEFGPDGRVVKEGQVKEARFAMLGNVLSAAAKSLLNANPNYVVDGASAAGEKYRQDLDAAHARNISERTLKFHEAQIKMALETGSINNTNNKQILKKMERDLKNEEIMRKNVGAAARPVNAIIAEQIDETAASGAWGDPSDPSVKRRVEIEKGKLPLIAAYYQAGFADKAIALQAEVQSSLPAYAQQNVSAKIQSLMDTYTAFQSMSDEERAGLEFDPSTGTLVVKADKDLEREGLKSRNRAQDAAAAVGFANAANIRQDTAMMDGVASGKVRGPLDPKDVTDINNAREEFNALISGLGDSALQSQISMNPKLDKYIGPLVAKGFDRNKIFEALRLLSENGQNPGVHLIGISRSGGNIANLGAFMNAYAHVGGPMPGMQLASGKGGGQAR